MSSSDAANGDNDGNADDVATINDIDDEDAIGVNDHSSHTTITITVHEG